MNVKMTKANQKMLTYVATLENEMDKQRTHAVKMKERGVYKSIYDCVAYSNAMTKWSYAIDMFCEVNGIHNDEFWELGSTHQNFYFQAKFPEQAYMVASL